MLKKKINNNFKLKKTNLKVSQVRKKRKYLSKKKLQFFIFIIKYLLNKSTTKDKLKFYKILNILYKRIQISKFKLKKKRNNIKKVKAYLIIKTSFNNTFINVINRNGKTLYTSCAGYSIFKHKRAEKGTALAARKLARYIGNKLKKKYITHIAVKFNGFYKKAKILALKELRKKCNIVYLQEIRKIPHGGCRPPKKVRK